MNGIDRERIEPREEHERDHGIAVGRVAVGAHVAPDTEDLDRGCHADQRAAAEEGAHAITRVRFEPDMHGRPRVRAEHLQLAGRRTCA